MSLTTKHSAIKNTRQMYQPIIKYGKQTKELFLFQEYQSISLLFSFGIKSTRTKNIFEIFYIGAQVY